MKFFIKLIAVSILSMSLQATSYVYIEEGVTLPLQGKHGDVVIYSGTPVKIHDSHGDEKKITISGYVDGKDNTKLYATPNHKLLLATSKNIKIHGDKGSIKAKISTDNLTEDVEEAWDVSSERFYEKCTQCHPAKVVDEHTMLEWEGLYGSMNEFAKPTKEDDELILRFLRAFSKDGIAKEAE